MEIFATIFTPVLVVALAAVILNSVVLRDAPPVKRAAFTAAGAWVIAWVGMLLLGEVRPQDVILIPVSTLVAAVVVGFLMWWSYAMYWVEEEPLAPGDEMALDGGDGYAPAAPEPEPHGNYLVRHWRGESTLGASYWLNNNIIGWGAFYALFVLTIALEDMDLSLQAAAAIVLFILAAQLIISTWAGVGTWRSAVRHESRGGAGGWAVAAQVSVAISALLFLAQLHPRLLSAREYAVLASGSDTLGEPGQVVVEGDTIRLEGNITSGISDRFAQALAAAPAVRTAVLNSPGGRQGEAERMARAIAARGLNTYAEGVCASACTHLLLAGRERSAEPGTPIGFHQPSFPGASRWELSGAIEQMGDDYRRAGVDPAFVERALQTPAQSLWSPPHDELVAARVLTSTEMVVGGGSERLHEDLERYAAEQRALGPQRIDRMTRLESVTARRSTLTFRYAADVDFDAIDVVTSRATFAEGARRQTCADPAAKAAIERGATMVYDYRDRAGKQLFDIRIDECLPD